MRSWLTWTKGLVSAAIGAAANGVTLIVVDPLNYNLGDGIGKLGMVCMVSALVAVAMYLKGSPLPD